MITIRLVTSFHSMPSLRAPGFLVEEILKNPLDKRLISCRLKALYPWVASSPYLCIKYINQCWVGICFFKELPDPVITQKT
jgi:hypothetical protein